MNKLEYLILERALTYRPWLREVADDYYIAHSDMAITAYRLFQNGDILADMVNNEDSIPCVALTLSEISAHLKWEIGVTYCLTSQGGARWETVAHPDWNRFYTCERYWNYHNSTASLNPRTYLEKEEEKEFVATVRQVAEKLLAIDCFVEPDKYIPGTEVWDVLEPWQPIYWKTLPRGYRVHYKCRSNYWYLNEDTPVTWVESNQQAGEWHAQMMKWYTKPELD